MLRPARRTGHPVRLLAALLLASVTLVTVDLQVPQGPTAAVRRAGSALLGPLVRAGGSASDAVAARWDALARADATRAELERLRAANAQLRTALLAGEDARARAGQLDRLLQLTGAGGYRVVPAQVVAVGPAQAFRRTATIDVGRLDGVRRDSTVLAGGGLAGRVLRVQERTSTMLLLVDASSAVGARLAASRDLAVVRGDGSGSLRVDLLDADRPLAAGQRLVTFGSRGGTPYVPGVPIGEVVAVDGGAGGAAGRSGTVRPSVDPDRLDLVGVVVGGPRRDPRDPLLPRRSPAAG